MRSDALTSNPELMASDPEQILRSTNVRSYYRTVPNPRNAVQELAVALEAVIKTEEEGPPSRLPPVHVVDPTLPELHNHLLLRPSIRHMAQDETILILVLEIDKSLIKSEENALSYGNQIGYEDANGGLQNASF